MSGGLPGSIVIKQLFYLQIKSKIKSLKTNKMNENKSTYSIEQAVELLHNGYAVERDVEDFETIEGLLLKAYPNDSGMPGVPAKYYYNHSKHKGNWACGKKTTRPTIKLSQIESGVSKEEKANYGEKCPFCKSENIIETTEPYSKCLSCGQEFI